MLRNKVAIVTGASSGIGKAVALALGSAGVKVTLAARRLDKLQDVEKTIKQNGGTSISVQTDVTDRQQVKAMVSETESKLGPVDILVNNAGVWFITWMKNCMEDKWDTMIDINVKGMTNCIGAVLDSMVKRGSGHIVNMSSDSGRKPCPGLAVYCGTKFYVEGLSQTMRLELKGTGVKVTCIQPGDVSLDDSSFDHCPDKEAEHIDNTDTFKTLDPVDIANAVLYAVNQPDHVAAENMWSTDEFKAMDPVDIANAVIYTLSQPDHVAVNELLVQTRDNPI